MKYENEIRSLISATISVTEPINEIKLEENLHNIGVDSIKFVRLIIEIENFFNIEFPYDKLTTAEAGTIKKLCDIVISANEE